MFKQDPIWGVYSEAINHRKGWGHVMAILEFDDSEEQIALAREIQEWLQTYKAYNGELMYVDGRDYKAHFDPSGNMMTSLDVTSGNLLHDSKFEQYWNRWGRMNNEEQGPDDKTAEKINNAKSTMQKYASPTAQSYADMYDETAATLTLDNETIDKIKYHAPGVDPKRSKQIPVVIYRLDPDKLYDYEEVAPDTYRRGRPERPWDEFYDPMPYKTISEWERAEEFLFEDEYTGWLDGPLGLSQDEELTDIRLKTAMSMLEHLGMVIFHADFSGGEDDTYIMLNNSRSPYMHKRIKLKDAYVKAWCGHYELQQLVGVGMLESQYEELINMYDLGQDENPSPFYIKETPTQKLRNFDF